MSKHTGPDVPHPTHKPPGDWNAITWAVVSAAVAVVIGYAILSLRAGCAGA